MDSLQNIALIFVAAALGGLTMLAMRLSGRAQPPTWLAIGHGLIALSGLVLLGRLERTTYQPDPVRWAIGCFLAAAAGGVFIFLRYHRRGIPLPIPLVLGHGLIAATGLVLLLKTAYGW